MSNEQKIAVVTGANRGIGFEVSRQLAKKGLKVLLCARSEEKGKTSAKKLQDEGLDVAFLQLDVTSEESIQSFASNIKSKYGRVDVLINNAGALLDPPRHPPDAEGASIMNAKLDTIRSSLETNTFGALRLTQLLAPLMVKGNYGRIVNISSGMGQLSEMNGGWPGYRISKVALNAVTKIFSDELKGTNVLVNSVCPGWVQTDMGGSEAERTPEEASDTIVWLATLPNDGTSGGFFRDKQQISW